MFYISSNISPDLCVERHRGLVSAARGLDQEIQRRHVGQEVIRHVVHLGEMYVMCYFGSMRSPILLIKILITYHGLAELPPEILRPPQHVLQGGVKAGPAPRPAGLV